MQGVRAGEEGPWGPLTRSQSDTQEGETAGRGLGRSVCTWGPHSLGRHQLHAFLLCLSPSLKTGLGAPLHTPGAPCASPVNYTSHTAL